jgi:putative hydrolase of the HAD superfamily
VVLFDVGHTLVFPPNRFFLQLSRIYGGSTDPDRAAEAERRARRVYEQKVLESGVSTHWRTYFETFYRVLGVDPDHFEDILLAIRYAHRQWIGIFHGVRPSVVALLSTLRAHGVRLGIISNADERLQAQLKALGLTPYFEHIVGSSDVKIEKPDPRIFEIALERMGVPPEETLYVGDYRWLDFEPARRLGMQALLVDPLGTYPEVPREDRVPRVEALLERFALEPCP